MTLITEYPLWFLPFCLLLGAAYAFTLYWKDRRFEAERRGLTWLLVTIRFLSVSFLSFLLLGPFVRVLFREAEKPIIIFAQDNSESILNDRDTVYYRDVYATGVRKLLASISEHFDVREYSFGNDVQPGLNFKFDQKETDLSVLFDELYTVFDNRNVGAIIVASDGNYNKGMNPLYVKGIKELNAPVYTIALGDTSIRKDLAIRKVVHNRLAYLGNDFPLEIQVHASRCSGDASELTVTKKGKVVFREKLEVKDNNFSRAIPLSLTANEAGIQHYHIALSTMKDEVNTVNNEKDIYIDVLDGRQRILLLYDAPHPDIGAIAQSISANENYEVSQWSFDRYLREDQVTQERLRSFDLIVLHQIPSARRNVDKAMQDILAARVPLLFVFGAQSDVRAVNTLGLGIEISGGQNKFSEATALLNRQFSLFSTSALNEQLFSGLPPLLVPFGKYSISKSASMLFTQRIGMVQTGQPLVVFLEHSSVKLGAVLGEGLWRWRLECYEASGSHGAFDGLISKIVQYLSVKEDRSNFKVLSKSNFLENEVIRFDAEVYNQSYELINEPEVKLTIINGDGQSYPYTFSRTTDAYKLEAGMLPVGNYTYKAHVAVGGTVYNEVGEFNISPVQVEAAITRADHRLLYNLASRYGGGMFSPDSLGEFTKHMMSSIDRAPVVYTEKHLKELINIKLLFAVLLILVSLEWFLRKRAGAY